MYSSSTSLARWLHWWLVVEWGVWDSQGATGQVVFAVNYGRGGSGLWKVWECLSLG